VTEASGAPSVACIGLGYWGSRLARNFAALDSLYALCDPDAQRLAEQAAHYPEARCCASWRDLLDDDAVRAVVIAAPPESHYELAEAFLRSGRDVFVEKPLCHELAHATELCAIARRDQRVLMTGHILNYHPAMIALRELSAAGELGELRAVSARRQAPGRVPTERSVLWNFGPHDCSLLLSICGRLPERVRAVGGRWMAPQGEDRVYVHLDFGAALTGSIELAWLHPLKEQRLVVIGSRRAAIFEDTRDWPEKLRVVDLPPDDRDGRCVRPAELAERAVPLSASEPLRGECAAFLDACRTRAAPLTDGEEALRVLAVLDAAQQSLDAGGDAVSPERALSNAAAGLAG